MTDIVRIDAALLSSRIAAILEQVGLLKEMAATEARVMVEADLHGVPSHGVRMLPPLLAALADGRATPTPTIRRLREFGATCLLDCDNAPGRYTSLLAMDDAILRAKSFGVGVCLAKRTTHWGRAHAYASHAAQQGFVGICTTNAMPTMAAWGSKGRVIGNNPIAFGLPRQQADQPMVLDIAMSQAAVGKVGTWLREGNEVPQGWGVDAEGKPSTDAKAILAGAVLPFGGHKGAGLALMMELLTAALGGGAFGNEILAGDRSGIDPESSKLFIALNPEAFGGLDVLTRRIADYLAYLGENAGQTEPFNWPGERGWKAYAANLAAGVPLHPEIAAQLAAVGIRFD